MKQIPILCGLLALAFGLTAQPNQKSNYIGIAGGGGMNTLLYNTVKGETSLGIGFTGELRYTHFFGKHFGIGLGAQFMQSSASTLYNFTDVTTGLTHDDNGNLTYDLRTTYTDWREKQTLNHIGVPVELYWRAPMGSQWAFLLGVGARLDLPLGGKYSATEGAYDNAGQFYIGGTPLSYTVEDLPEHGFRAYHADFKSDFNLDKLGVSIIADLGFNCAFSNHWSLYLGIYGGYGLTNLLDSINPQPVLSINATDASKLDYNGTLASNQVDALRLLSAGVKIGLNFGWNCHSASTESQQESILTPTEPTPQTNTAKEPPKQNNAAASSSYSNNGASADEEAAAREARCNARRMNNPDLAQAVANIEADLNEASQTANEANSEAARNAILDARATTSDAMQAHKKGQYCKAYNLFNEVYGSIADSYAATAAAHARTNGSERAKKAADDAALYAEAAHKDGLDCAMAASRNAKLNSDIARNGDAAAEASPAYNDPAFASRMADGALALSNESASKPALTNARDASGKAYRGKLADSYAASAKSFAESAKAYATKKGTDEARAAADEAQRYAAEAAEAARMGNTAAAYRAARAAQQAAQRARDGKAAAPAAAPAKSATATTTTAQLRQYIDQLSTSVHYGFGELSPEIDLKASVALEALCAAMKADKGIKILITGHTDNVGTEEGNLAIGQRRADALKRLLVKHGAPAASIQTASKGQGAPLVPNDTDEHRAQNRRAVISLQ